MKKNNIQEIAAQILAANTKLKEVFMTSDGQGFSDENIAKGHQGTIDAKIEVQTFKREVTSGNGSDGGSVVDLSVADLKEAIKDEKNIDVLNDLLDKETAKGEDKRKGALAAIQERIDAVSKDN